MGLLSAAVKVAAGSAVALYFVGRKGVVKAAGFAGGVVGQTIGGMRRSRGEMQRKLTEEESPEQRQEAREMQKGWWEVRMIMNEFAMLRSFNPRLLQSGNFGFTDEEMLTALGQQPANHAASEASRVAHIERQLDMERQQLENPRMWPLAGHHGSGNDTEALASLQGQHSEGLAPGADVLRAGVGKAPDLQPGMVEVTRPDGSRELRAGVARTLTPMEMELSAMTEAAAPAPVPRPTAAAAASPKRASTSSMVAQTLQDLETLRSMAAAQDEGGTPVER